MRCTTRTLAEGRAVLWAPLGAEVIAEIDSDGEGSERAGGGIAAGREAEV